MTDFRNSLSARILRELARGPRTNRELQEALCAHCGEIARDCAKLIERGLVRRIDGKRGRGTYATYARAA